MSNKAIVRKTGIRFKGQGSRQKTGARGKSDVAYDDARKYLPALLEKRGVQSTAAMKVLDSLEAIVQSIDLDLYVGLQQQALKRIAVRDADDWPVLACAMTIGCPVWTEDADFFGAGVATWTTDRVELYLVE